MNVLLWMNIWHKYLNIAISCWPPSECFSKLTRTTVVNIIVEGTVVFAHFHIIVGAVLSRIYLRTRRGWGVAHGAYQTHCIAWWRPWTQPRDTARTEFKSENYQYRICCSNRALVHTLQNVCVCVSLDGGFCSLDIGHIIFRVWIHPLDITSIFYAHMLILYIPSLGSFECKQMSNRLHPP